MRPPQKTGENATAFFSERVNYLGFNEAPAEDGGKRRIRGYIEQGIAQASMRPPQKTGENFVGEFRQFIGQFASMRPPQKTGENAQRFVVYDPNGALQ